jgi:DNA-binding NarL/FixJ family response regulator/quercetin dioxygenase-like cupin family protein
MTRRAEPVRIVVADDFPEMLHAVELCLAPDFDIAAKVGDGAALVECVRELAPEIVVTDLSMPKLTGMEALRQLRTLNIDIPVIVLTVHDDHQLVVEAIALGVRGFVLKSLLTVDLPQAVREVLAGRIFLSEPLRKKSSGDGTGAVAEADGDAAIVASILLNRSGLLIARSEVMEWQAAGPLGVWIKPLFTDEEHHVATSLVRMDPGAHYPRHRHNGVEFFFVLSGDFQIEGEKMRAGDYCRAHAGSIHGESYSETGCIGLLSASQFDEILP